LNRSLSREADLSAEPPCAQAPPRLPRAHGDEERPEGDRAPSRQGPQAPHRLTSQATFPIERLKKRPDFLAAAKGRSASRGCVVVQGLDRADGEARVRVGFTATRKIGGAVVRNRAKRRLREAARALVPLLGKPGWDYVLIARSGAPTRRWAALLDDVKTALIRLAADGEALSAPERT
jgi:ribonuclease P protein component